MRWLEVAGQCPFVVQMLLVEREGADALDEAFKPLLRLLFDRFELVFKLGRFPLLN